MVCIRFGLKAQQGLDCCCRPLSVTMRTVGVISKIQKKLFFSTLTVTFLVLLCLRFRIGCEHHRKHTEISFIKTTLLDTKSYLSVIKSSAYASCLLYFVQHEFNPLRCPSILDYLTTKHIMSRTPLIHMIDTF